jgi:hypothetical protein
VSPAPEDFVTPGAIFVFEDGITLSDRWADAQPTASSTASKARDAMRKDKEDPSNPSSNYLKFI